DGAFALYPDDAAGDRLLRLQTPENGDRLAAVDGTHSPADGSLRRSLPGVHGDCEAPSGARRAGARIRGDACRNSLPLRFSARTGCRARSTTFSNLLLRLELGLVRVVGNHRTT